MSDTRAEYIHLVLKTLEENPEKVARWLTRKCPECEGDYYIAPDYHVTIYGHVVIGCEGYYVINPNAVGMEMPNWSDWTD